MNSPLHWARKWFARAPHWWGAALALILVVCGTLLALQEATGRILHTDRIRLRNASLGKAEGGIFKASSTSWKPRLDNLHRRARIEEDGKPLANRSVSSQRVREGEVGSYSMGGISVWLKTSDGSDPRTNGRTYEMILPRWISPHFDLVAWLAVIVGLRVAWWAWMKRRGATPGNALIGRQLGAGSRLWSLDILRGVAAMLVVLAHLERFPPDDPSLLALVVRWIVANGEMGVDLFFVLSGYLVSGLLFDEWKRKGSLDIGRFFLRRSLKLYPPLWVLVIGTLVMGCWHQLPSLDKVICEFFFLQNYLTSVWPQTWSLAVEEHFYILLSLLFACLSTSHRSFNDGPARTIRNIALFVMLICPLMRCARMIFLGEASYMGNYTWTHLHMDGLMSGVLLRWWQTTRPLEFARFHGRRAAAWALCGVALFVPNIIIQHASPENGFASLAPLQAWWTRTLAFNLSYLAAAALVLCAVSVDGAAIVKKLTAPFQMIGRHSYSIYLWHFLFNEWMARPLLSHWVTEERWSFPVAWSLYAVIYMGGSIASGWLMGRLVEQPVLEFRDAYFPSRSAPVQSKEAQEASQVLSPQPIS